jgi:hypothetical protein
MPTSFHFMQAALFCISNLVALWVAARCANGLATRRLDFLMGCAALYPLCAVLLILGGGLAGCLNAKAITLALITVAGALLVWGRRGGSPYTFDTAGLRPAGTARFAIAMVIAFASLPIARIFSAGTGYFIDDFGYHAVAVASWMQQGDFRQFMPQFMAYLPVNAELLCAWFAAPFHNDVMVVLAGVVWLILAAVAGGGIARLSGSDATASLLVAATVMAAPTLVWQTRTFSASDLAGAATLLAAVYFAATMTTTKRFSHAALAGLLAGFAAGGKATFLPVAAVICLWPLSVPIPWRRRFAFVAVTSLAAAALGSVWYFRNGLATANPLFPAEIGPLAGPLHREDQAGIKLTGLLASVPWTARLWGNMIYDYLNWPLPLGLFAVAGYGRAIIAEWTRATPRAAADTGLRRLLLIGGLVQFVLHFFAPFCIGGGYADGKIAVYSRYVMPWFVFGIALAGPLLDSRSRFAWGWRILLGAGLAMCWPVAGIMCLGGVALALGGLTFLRWMPPRIWKPCAILILAAIWPALALLAPRMRAVTERHLRDELTKGGKSWGKAILALEALPDGTRIARFANESYFNSPIFGRQWQFHPVFTDDQGRELPPLHLQFKTTPALHFFATDPSPLPSAHELIVNLRAASISHVFVSKFRTADWPPQQALLKNSGEATAWFDDGDTTVWHLSPPGP